MSNQTKTLKQCLTDAWIHMYGNGKPYLTYELKAVREWLTQKRQELTSHPENTLSELWRISELDILLEELNK